MDFKKCGINTVTPMTTDDKTNVTTPDKPDLQQWTPEQIKDFCEARPGGMVFVHAVQIIRQLQEPQEVDLEILAAAVHDAYCRYYVQTHDEQYWTNGDYMLLDEKTKEIDRETVRAVLRQQNYARIKSHKEPVKTRLQGCDGG